MESVVERKYSLSVNVRNSYRFCWWVSTLYGPSNNKDRDFFRKELNQLKYICYPNWLLARDFDIVRWLSKTNAKHIDRRNMENFNNFIRANDLIDPPLINNEFTWSNLRTKVGSFFFYTKDWELAFKHHISKTLKRTISDHFPITLENSQIKWGLCPFRLNNTSLKEKDFIKNIQDWWKNTYQQGHPSYSFIQRLKALTLVIKNWQMNKVSNYGTQKENILKEIETIDRLEFPNSLTEHLHSKRLSLKSDLHGLELKQAQIWRQRAR